MHEIALNTQQHQDQPIVWILETGEFGEGGTILGVYMDRDLARGQFVTEAQQLHDRFTIDDIRQDDDGSIHAEAGCDWLSLTPHPVTTSAQLTQGKCER